MRIRHRYLTYDSRSIIISPLRAILDRFNISYKYKEDLNCVIPTFKYSLEFYLYEDNPAFSSVRAEVEQYKVRPQTGTYYEKADIENAEWFIASTGHYQYPQPEDRYLQATFNLDTYCKLCGIGKIQNAPFRLKTEPKQHNSQFWGLHWEYEPLFVRQETRTVLERAGIKGIRFFKSCFRQKKCTN